MTWKTLTINVHASLAQALSDALLACGALSVSLESGDESDVFQTEPNVTPLWNKTKMSVLLDPQQDSNTILQQAKMMCGLSTHLNYQEGELADQDWVRLTQQQFKPKQFARRLWVCPNHCDASRLTGAIIKIDPGLAFGTGTHPTTSLCLDWLASHPVKQHDIIDYGCGSGVLALAAKALGANQVWAVDHDEQAIIASKNNAALNNFASDLHIDLASNLPAMQVDIVIANILANPLIELAPRLTALVKPKSTLLLSGILVKEMDKVINAYKAQQMQCVSKIIYQDWGLIQLMKP